MSEQPEKNAVQIPVLSEDPKSTKKQNNLNNKKARDEAQKISEEDEQIKSQVELLVTRIGDSNPQIAANALKQLIDLLRTQSGSVASVPKPLKFIRSMFSTLEGLVSTVSDKDNATRLHDVMSFVGMTIAFPDGKHGTLEHKLLGTPDDLEQWGHEYLRFLSGEIAVDYKERVANGQSTEKLHGFITQIIRFMVAHQDEPTAIDLLMEVEKAEWIVPHVEEGNYKRVAKYMEAISRYLTRPADVDVLRLVYDLYVKMSAFCDALRIALQLRDKERVMDLFQKCESKPVQYQMALICARYRMFFDKYDEENPLLSDANGNVLLSKLYRDTAKKLDTLAPKSPDDIFKSTSPAPTSGSSKNRLKHLSTTLVSGLANCGYGTDTVMTGTEATWLYVNENRLRMSTAASVGLLHLWDHTDGLIAAESYVDATCNYVKAGGLIAIGIVMCGVQMVFDAASQLLEEHLSSENTEVRIGAIMGMGLSHAGMPSDSVKDLLIVLLVDSDQPQEVRCMAAYALALMYVGTSDGELAESMMVTLMELPEEKLTDPSVRYLVLAIGCIFLGKQDDADTVLEAVNALSPVVKRYADIVIRSCAYAATGNVVVIQSFFNTIAEVEEEDEEEKKDDDKDEVPEGRGEKASSANAAATIASLLNGTASPQGLAAGSFDAEGSPSGSPAGEEPKEPAPDAKPKPLNHKAAAVLGIALVALGEELGTEMAKRSIIHALLADSVDKKGPSMSGRRAVPLAYALLSASDPNMTVVEALSRLSHDSDVPTATNAILAMGIAAAGSNNARVANMLRGLASYYRRDGCTKVRFFVRLAQGLTALGKGNMTISPLLSDKTLVSPSALVGLLGLLHSALDADSIFFGNYHYMIYSLVPSINARMVVAVDSELEPIPEGVQVRVGQPVDTVAVPGKPKSITGFQTSSTPFLLSETDRVELASTKYSAIPSIIEGIVVVEPAKEGEHN